MTHYYCMYLSKDYIAKGLVLYDSIREHDMDFRLFMVLEGEATYRLVKSMALTDVILINMSSIENEDIALLRTKSKRKAHEYAWTAKASILLYLFYHYDVIDHMIWLDGDTCFLADPQPIYEAFEGNEILLTEERYTEQFAPKAAIYGRFQMGFCGFRRSANALACLRQWREQCINWCYDRFEDGKWADQMYVNSWPEQFERVGIVAHPGINMNPFILNRYHIERDGEITKLQEDTFVGDIKIILFHYFGFQYFNENEFNLCKYGTYLSPQTIEIIYIPYVKKTIDMVMKIRRLDKRFYKLMQPNNRMFRNYFNLRLYLNKRRV